MTPPPTALTPQPGLKPALGWLLEQAMHQVSTRQRFQQLTLGAVLCVSLTTGFVTWAQAPVNDEFLGTTERWPVVNAPWAPWAHVAAMQTLLDDLHRTQQHWVLARHPVARAQYAQRLAEQIDALQTHLARAHPAPPREHQALWNDFDQAWSRIQTQQQQLAQWSAEYRQPEAQALLMGDGQPPFTQARQALLRLMDALQPDAGDHLSPAPPPTDHARSS